MQIIISIVITTSLIIVIIMLMELSEVTSDIISMIGQQVSDRPPAEWHLWEENMEIKACKYAPPTIQL